MKKIIITTSGFDRQLRKLEKQKKFSEQDFVFQIKQFFQDEQSSRFRKHKIVRSDTLYDVYSISLGYDLRSLYYRVEKKNDEILMYTFFGIGIHDDIY